MKEEIDVHRQNLIECGLDIDQLVKEFATV